MATVEGRHDSRRCDPIFPTVSPHFPGNGCLDGGAERGHGEFPAKLQTDVQISSGAVLPIHKISGFHKYLIFFFPSFSSIAECMVDQLTPGKYQVKVKLCWLSCLYMAIVLVTGVNSSPPPLPTQKQKWSEMQPDRLPPN